MNHESPMYVIADALLDYFDDIGATDYIEQTFECKKDPSKSFVVTMQKVDGLTKLNAEMYNLLLKVKSARDVAIYEIEHSDPLHEICDDIEELLIKVRER